LINYQIVFYLTDLKNREEYHLFLSWNDTDEMINE